MSEQDDTAESWSESERSEDGPGASATEALLSTPKKRKRDLDDSDFSTPAPQRIAQLITPPNTKEKYRQPRTKHLIGQIDSRSQQETREIILLLESHAELGFVSTRISTHLLRQEKLLHATLQARDLLRTALRGRDIQADVLNQKLLVAETEKESDRGVISALKRDLARLKGRSSD